MYSILYIGIILFILYLIILYLIIPHNNITSVIEGAKNRGKHNKQSRDKSKPSATKQTPIATKAVIFFRKTPGYNRLPSSMRGLFENFVRFIIFF